MDIEFWYYRIVQSCHENPFYFETEGLSLIPHLDDKVAEINQTIDNMVLTTHDSEADTEESHVPKIKRRLK